MDKKAIFIGGIHGVGKSTLCERLSSVTGIKHYSASGLINSLKRDSINNRDKRVHDIDNNQELLITAMHQYIDQNSLFLLDGHFCLLNSKNEITKIPKETFTNIEPVAIITLYDSIENIQEKITKRDSVHYGGELLSSFQSCEIEYSENIARELKIPHISFDVTNDIPTLLEFITDLTCKDTQ